MSTMTVTSKIDHRYLMNKSKYDLACFTMMIVDMKTDLEVENARLKRMLDWALKPETQAKLQADFDEYDRMMKNTGNA